jgi:hypothetical protein
MSFAESLGTDTRRPLRLVNLYLGEDPWRYRPAGPAQYAVDGSVYALNGGQLVSLPAGAPGSELALHPPRHGDMLRTSENRGCGTFFLEAVGPLHPRRFYLWSALTEYGYWVHPAVSDCPKDYYRGTESPVVARWAALSSDPDGIDSHLVSLEAHLESAEYLEGVDTTFPIGHLVDTVDQHALLRRFQGRAEALNLATRSLVWYSLCQFCDLTRDLSNRIAAFVTGRIVPPPAPHRAPGSLLRVGATLSDLEAAETAGLPLPLDATPHWSCSLSASQKQRYRSLMMRTETLPDSSSLPAELMACCNASKMDAVGAAIEHLVTRGKQHVAVLTQGMAGIPVDVEPVHGANICAVAEPERSILRIHVGVSKCVTLCCFDAVVISDGGIFLKSEVPASDAEGAGVSTTSASWGDLESLRVVTEHAIEEAAVLKHEQRLTSSLRATSRASAGQMGNSVQLSRQHLHGLLRFGARHVLES